MHPLLSKMLARRVDRPAGAQPPPFDRTALSARDGMLDRREGENVSIKSWLLAGLATTLLIGCDVQVQADWERAPREYTCSLEDQARVERETLFCNTNTGYRSVYCYGTAIMRNCDKIEPENSNEDAASEASEVPE